MSIELTVVKTREEHWVQLIGIRDTFLKLEFSGEHQISNEGNRTIVTINKKSELYKAFDENQNAIFNLGVERALEVVLKELYDSKLDKKRYRSIKQKISLELEKENRFGRS